MILNRNTQETKFDIEEEFDHTHVYLMTDDGDQSKSLMAIFDTNSCSEEKRKLDVKFIDRGSCIVSLPNSRLFCCGNGSFSQYAFAYIIDTKSWSYTMLPSRSWFFSAGGIYHNDNVYIFWRAKE